MAKVCLVIDDVEVTRFTASTLLEELGVDAVSAETPEQALEMAGKHPVNVVLLDWHLKKKSGLDLIQELRAKLGATVPVIVFSGVEDKSKAQEAIQSGASDFLEKPTTREKLEASLQKVGVL